ncbi:hypothetical protein Osc7112_5979 [Oscillatoria nigro-viridis PCC 7112]|uniref:Uncharacterized protein n=1 Tax=Phormidium nigroviride PCC 7112 TaxID=179408 RepID=K9VQ08_9CYAN|nr:hypothetical protein [Oscillatoria nigro-viridis]AFZ10173.1 hypothetical protein Osc7112_5979 [Oscillatoria nigro-viridis PCC 7112]
MKQAEGLRNYAFLDDRPFAGRFFLAQLKHSRSPSRRSETALSNSIQRLQGNIFAKNPERLSVCG